MATMNVSLPAKMKAWVEAQTTSGRYANVSDYVRDLVRRDEERNRVDDEIMAAAAEGLASGFSERTPEEIRDAVLAEMELRPKAKRRAV